MKHETTYYNKKCAELLGYTLTRSYFSIGEGTIRTEDVVYKFNSDWNELLPVSQKVYEMIEGIMMNESNIFLRNELGNKVNNILREWYSNIKIGTPQVGFNILCELIDFVEEN